MMSQKVQYRHLARRAYLYVRHATSPEASNTESAQRQYALKHTAVALGWPVEQIVVMDTDFGKSAASTNEREGFQSLLTEISRGRIGLVMAIDVSRLTRNSAELQELLGVCALTDTLILLGEEIYDLADSTDRLLTGFKGRVSSVKASVSA